ncbi:hypothetical protein [uncultured Methylobacterium sp.]|jgi:hypothetical protein|uniref:hypothetical protein n=1 Tax=uncultured Methylobacterium sp. TaxID=157278 RepID=UPI0026355F6E|nr:hypothetical protein [uncultured Methylobacterium sp.]
MDDLRQFRALTADEIVASLAALGEAVARLSSAEARLTASLVPEGVRLERSGPGGGRPTHLIALRDLGRKPAHLLVMEVERFARST